MTIARELLQPAVVLAGWTMVMLIWMVSVRLPALRKAGIDIRTLNGGKGSDTDRVLPGKPGWPAHNYNHLLEQPTAFYAVVLVLALLGANDMPTRVAAWAYVTLRIVHSVWQATVNQVSGRFLLFFLSSLALILLVVRAALAAWGVAATF